MSKSLLSRNKSQYSGSNIIKNKVVAAFVSLIFMGFLLNYVESMVIPSIPRLQLAFHSIPAVSSWLVSAFLITAATASPLFGRLGDNYGKKKMLIVALSIYTIGVGIAGFSTSIGELIFARALQGMGFGGIPIAFAIIADIFPRERIGQALGVMSALFASGGVAGLIAGSYIMASLGWQWAFHSALIVSIGLLLAIFINISRDIEKERETIDYLGAALLTSSITLLLLYITRGVTSGWASATNFSLLGAGIVLGVVFMLQERRSKQPLIHLNLMSQRNIMVSNLIGIFTMALMQIMFLSIVYFADDPVPFGKGFTSIQTGLVLAPGAIVMAAVGPAIGRLMTRTGPKPLISLGAVTLAVGMLAFMTERGNLLWLIASGIAIWTGMVSLFVPITNMISVTLPQERRAAGLGMNMMLRNIGGSVGPSVASAVMTSYSSPVAASAVYGSAGLVSATRAAPSFPTAYAFDILMVIGLVLSVAILLINLGTWNHHFVTKEKGKR